MPPPWAAMSDRSGCRSRKPSKTIRVIASVVSNMKPTDHDRSNLPRSMRSAPGGSPGCTRTGSARRSIARQTGANSASVSERPAMFAMTMTPTAPSSQARASSSTARSGYSHGSDANQRMRVGYARCGLGHRRVRLARRFRADRLAAPVHVRAGQRHDRDVDAGLVHHGDPPAVVEVAGLRDDDRRLAAVDLLLAVGAGTDDTGSPLVRRRSIQRRVNMWVWTSMIGMPTSVTPYPRGMAPPSGSARRSAPRRRSCGSSTGPAGAGGAKTSSSPSARCSRPRRAYAKVAKLAGLELPKAPGEGSARRDGRVRSPGRHRLRDPVRHRRRRPAPGHGRSGQRLAGARRGGLDDARPRRCGRAADAPQGAAWRWPGSRQDDRARRRRRPRLRARDRRQAPRAVVEGPGRGRGRARRGPRGPRDALRRIGAGRPQVDRATPPGASPGTPSTTPGRWRTARSRTRPRRSVSAGQRSVRWTSVSPSEAGPPSRVTASPSTAMTVVRPSVSRAVPVPCTPSSRPDGTSRTARRPARRCPGRSPTGSVPSMAPR